MKSTDDPSCGEPDCNAVCEVIPQGPPADTNRLETRRGPRSAP